MLSAFTQYLVCVFGIRRSFFFFDAVVFTGAFLAGVIVPRDGGLAIALTEKLEDMVTVIFLPLVSVVGSDSMHILKVTSILRFLDCPRTFAC